MKAFSPTNDYLEMTDEYTQSLNATQTAADRNICIEDSCKEIGRVIEIERQNIKRLKVELGIRKNAMSEPIVSASKMKSKIFNDWKLRLEHQVKRQLELEADINQRFIRFYNFFESHSKLTKRAVEISHIDREWARTIGENCKLFEDFLHSVIVISQNIKKANMPPKLFSEVLKLVEDNSPRAKHDSISSDSIDDETSDGELESSSEQRSQPKQEEQLGLSQFVDPNDSKTLWSHERSFRDKTSKAVVKALSKNKKTEEIHLSMFKEKKPLTLINGKDKNNYEENIKPSLNISFNKKQFGELSKNLYKTEDCPSTTSPNKALSRARK